METLSNNIATESSNKSETEINHKVSRQAQVKDPTKPKQKIQKPLTDLAVISSRIDSSDTITASSSETDINNQILEVFRQAKEIIEYYSNQKDVATLF